MSPRRWRRALFLALFVTSGSACPLDAVSSSSTIALGDGLVWVSSPDDDAVIGVAPATLEEQRRVAVPGAPDELLRVGTSLYVSLEQASDVARLDDGGGVTRLPVPCGGTRGLALLEHGGERLLAVACPNDDRVVLLDDDGALFARVAVPGRPDALVANGKELWVATSTAGAVVVLDTSALSRGENKAAAGLLVTRHVLEPAHGVAAIQLVGAATAPGKAPLFAYQRVSHDEDRERPAELGGYGSVTDDEPRIAPRLFGAGCESYARFDGGPLVASGPSALAYAPATDTLWVAHLYTDNVVVLSCRADAPGRVVAVFRTGRGPRGLLLSEDGRSAVVDVGFDHALAKLTLPAGATEDEAPLSPLEPTLVKRRALGDARLSSLAREGRSLFFDATNTHLTPSGVVTCGTCHPRGGDDGLSWFLHTSGVPRKLRRTPPAWGAREELSPLHWDGAFTSATALVEGTIRELMEGDALLVSSDAIAAYLEELPPPFPRPSNDEDGGTERGQALFHDDATRCAECHLPPLYGGAGLHAVTTSSGDPDGALAAASTPPLVGVRARAPFLHDGRAPTLESLFREHNDSDLHGGTSHLTSDELAELVRFLESL